ITTPDILVAPEAPDPVEVPTSGTLPAGLYYYALTALRGSEESPLGTQTSITLTDNTSAVALTLPAVPTGATTFQLWRMNAADVRLDSADAAIVTAGAVAAWRVYRTETPSAYPEDALVQHVIERDDPYDTGDPGLPLVTHWRDEGGLLTSGVPPLSSTQMQLA